MSAQIKVFAARLFLVSLGLGAALVGSAEADQSARDTGDGVPACNSLCRSWMGIGEEAGQPQPKLPEPVRPAPPVAAPSIDLLPRPLRATAATKVGTAKPAAPKAVQLPVSAALGNSAMPKSAPARDVLRLPKDGGARRSGPATQALAPKSGPAVREASADRPPLAAVSSEVPRAAPATIPGAGPASEAMVHDTPVEAPAVPAPAPQAVAAASGADLAPASMALPAPPAPPPVEAAIVRQDVVAAPAPSAKSPAETAEAVAPSLAEPVSQVAPQAEAAPGPETAREPAALPLAGRPTLEEPGHDKAQLSLVGGFYLALMIIVGSLFRTPAGSRREWDNERLTLA